MAKKKTRDDAKVHDGAGSAPQLIDPMWILKSLAAVIVLSLICAYLVMAGLFYQGSWQLLLHPQHTLRLLELPNLATETVRYASDAEGQPRLTGYWITGQSSQFAVLYLRNGDLSLATDAVDQRNLLLLHQAGLSVLAFDYRGYGENSKTHPNEKTMLQDAVWSFTYLEQQRNLQPDHILLFGEGLGASLAAQLALQHTAVAALIVDQPNATARQQILRDPRARILPAQLLIRDTFELASPLEQAQPPKLLLQAAPEQTSAYSENDRAVALVFQQASSPKTVVFLPQNSVSFSNYQETLQRFLDSWVPSLRASLSFSTLR